MDNPFQAPQLAMSSNRTIHLPLHSLGEEPMIRVVNKDIRNDRIKVWVETPKPLFFTGNDYAYDWSYKVVECFSGESLEACLDEAKKWANYLLDFQEDCCYAATGPLIEH